MNKSKISIIIPVYNVEKYLNRCVDSILSQTFSDFEVLLIDDGSPDNSGKICDEYAVKDNRVRVFHKKNGGVSSARNLGLDKAIGDYIMFVDSDDWISDDCLEVCMKEITKNDLDALQFGFISVHDEKEIPQMKEQTQVYNGEQYINANNFNVCVGGGLYKRYIIEDNSLKFPVELKLAEDQIFILNFFRYAKRIKYLNAAMYYYLQRGDSAVHNSKSEDMLLSCDYLIEFSQQWPSCKYHVDSLIIFFILSMIKNGDVSCSSLRSIYEKQNIKVLKSGSQSQIIFSVIAVLNFKLAYFVVLAVLKLNNL